MYHPPTHPQRHYPPTTTHRFDQSSIHFTHPPHTPTTGGRRKITVPPELAFGKKGLPPFIPSDATVLFDVSIWSIKPAGTNPNLTLPGQQNYF